MLILDRYIVGRFFKNFLTCLFIFLFLYVVIDLLSNLEDIIKNHPPVLKVAELYLYSLPLILTQTIPVAALLATLFTLGGLNQNNEVIAMRASGVTVSQIVRPFFLIGLVLSLGIFWISESVLPQAQRLSTSLKQVYIDKKAAVGAERPVENVAVYGFNNRLFFINKLYPQSKKIDGLTILEHDKNQNVISKIYADKAVWRDNRWILYNAFVYRLGDNQRVRGEPLYFTDTFLKIQETPQDFLRQNIPVESMNIRELAQYISRLPEGRLRQPEKEANPTITRLKVDLYQKTVFPFTTLVVILIGIPSSIMIRGRAVAFSSIGLCIGISFLFYVLFAVCLALGKGGGLPPFLAAWASHATFGLIGLYLISRIP
ncbi:MAG: LptF/LptG family permease [Deltaproteobacteria bacterium]